jgi:hypothetical protein
MQEDKMFSIPRWGSPKTTEIHLLDGITITCLRTKSIMGRKARGMRTAKDERKLHRVRCFRVDIKGPILMIAVHVLTNLRSTIVVCQETCRHMWRGALAVTPFLVVVDAVVWEEGVDVEV